MVPKGKQTHTSKGMKRKGNLYDQICSLENLHRADAVARIGKKKQRGIIIHDRNRESNILALQEMLVTKTYRTSKYKVIKINDPKEREVFKLPYYPDRILQHAAVDPIEHIITSSFTSDTYASIKGMGAHKASDNLKRALLDLPSSLYCLKLDIRKFYPSIDHTIMKALIARKIKDADLLWLLGEIIDSAPGLPIGNYSSGIFANLYLSGLDHYLKEHLFVRDYFRYMDDMVIPASSKTYLHFILGKIREYLADRLKLEIKSNYQIFPVESRGIDFVGYVHFHGYTYIRPGIKKRFAKSVAKKRWQSIASYYGWAKHANSNNLLKKLIYNNEKFQGFQHIGEKQDIYGPTDRSRRDFQSGDNYTGIQNSAIEISGQIGTLLTPAVAF